MLMLTKQQRDFVVCVIAVSAAWGCAPQRPYRAPVPPSSRGSEPNPRVAPPPPVQPPAPTVETSRKPLPQGRKIREQDIRATPTSPSAAPNHVMEPENPRAVGEPPGPSEAMVTPPMPPLADDSSLMAKITPGVSPQRAASLRLTEEGRKLLDAGDPVRAITRLERTIVIDSTNGYGYFYLAKAHYTLGHFQQSLNFIEVAHARLGGEQFWLSELYALRGENYRALGQTQQAETSYHQALRLNSGNRTASEALSHMSGDPIPAALK